MPRATGSWKSKGGSCPGDCAGSAALPPPCFRPAELWKKSISVVLNHPIWCILLPQLWETKTDPFRKKIIQRQINWEPGHVDKQQNHLCLALSDLSCQFASLYTEFPAPAAQAVWYMGQIRSPPGPAPGSPSNQGFPDRTIVLAVPGMVSNQRIRLDWLYVGHFGRRSGALFVPWLKTKHARIMHSTQLIMEQLIQYQTAFFLSASQQDMISLEMLKRPAQRIVCFHLCFLNMQQ